MTDKTEKPGEKLPNPNIKEQDKGIIEAFSLSDHRILTNTEIAERVSISKRQVRRRLEDMADRGILGVRTKGGVKFAWLEEEVKEPVSVPYPLFRYIRNHLSVQFFLAGAVVGIVAVLVLLAGAISIGYDVAIPYVTKDQILVYGVAAAVISALFIISAIFTAIVERAFRYFDIV